MIGHNDPIAPVIFGVTLILVAALFGRYVARFFNQPSVLGELLMGIQVKLETFLDWNVVLVATGLTIAAILGKLASGLGALGRLNRMAIGIGMMPRGEVGLVFASIGKTLGVIGPAMFSAVVLMVIVTTLATPPLLKAAMKKQEPPPGDEPGKPLSKLCD